MQPGWLQNRNDSRGSSLPFVTGSYRCLIWPIEVIWEQNNRNRTKKLERISVSRPSFFEKRRRDQANILGNRHRQCQDPIGGKCLDLRLRPLRNTEEEVGGCLLGSFDPNCCPSTEFHRLGIGRPCTSFATSQQHRQQNRDDEVSELKTRIYRDRDDSNRTE